MLASVPGTGLHDHRRRTAPIKPTHRFDTVLAAGFAERGGGELRRGVADGE
jgi:hypothetical protein